MPKRTYPYQKRPEYDQLFHQILNRIRDRSNAALSRDSFLSASTFRQWRLSYADGGTRYPRSVSLQEAARLAGLKLELVPHTHNSHLPPPDALRKPPAPPKRNSKNPNKGHRKPLQVRTSK